MRFKYIITYVSSVPETLACYEKAFGLQTGFLHESELYGEFKTGAITLAFAANKMAQRNGLSVRPNHADERQAG